MPDLASVVIEAKLTESGDAMLKRGQFEAKVDYLKAQHDLAAARSPGSPHFGSPWLIILSQVSDMKRFASSWSEQQSLLNYATQRNVLVIRARVDGFPIGTYNWLNMRVRILNNVQELHGSTSDLASFLSSVFGRQIVIPDVNTENVDIWTVGGVKFTHCHTYPTITEY